MQKSIFILCFTITVILISCSPKQAQTITNGTYISSIKEGIILDQFGNEFVIDIKENDKIYYLVRHAEKDTVPANNPILTDTGIERANYLANMMKGTRIDGVYSTMYTRTLFTIDTLASRKGLKILPYKPSDLKSLYETISQDSTKSAVIIAGHSNTTPALANVILGRQEFPTGFDESDYDNILIVLERADEENVVYKLRYKSLEEDLK